MNNDQEATNQDILLSIPIKVSFISLKNYLNKEFKGKIISRDNSNGKRINYFKILEIDIAKSTIKKYNLELIVKLETLTTLYKSRELEISIQTFVNMDMESQKIYIETYKIDSTGKSWFANQMLKSVINTFMYRKFIKKLNIELLPIITENLMLLNAKLASKIEIKSGISVLGALNDLTVTHFEIKQKNIWIIVTLNGWGIIEVENLDF
jgi:hypothetical protein